MVRDSLLQREEKDPRMIKLNNSLESTKNVEGRLIGAIKKHPLTRLVKLHSALLGDVPNRRERNNEILSRLIK